jgi:hypothetical protein
MPHNRRLRVSYITPFAPVLIASGRWIPTRVVNQPTIHGPAKRWILSADRL